MSGNFAVVTPLLKRLLDAQDRLLDHLNEPEPDATAVLRTFEAAYAAIREATAAVEHQTSNEQQRQIFSTAEHLPELMKRVKEHMDRAARVKSGGAPDFY